MLKHISSPSYARVKHLIATRPGIIVTNICNLSCGGCYAQCGKFEKNKNWSITIDQFEENLEYIIKYMYQGTATIANGEVVPVNSQSHPIDIIGGEPTVHPQWDKIWDLATKKYAHVNFLISTNGRVQFPPAANISYHLSYKTKDVGRQFAPTLVAPIDIVGNPNKKFYWESAQTDCRIWKSLGCVNPIYKNSISICSVASSWNDLLDLDLGWPLLPNKNPFSELTDKDVQEKAANVCYRCGWAKMMNLPEDQQSQLYDLVSPSNLEVLHKNPRNKPYKIIYREGDEIKVSELKNTRQPDLIQLMRK